MSDELLRAMAQDLRDVKKDVGELVRQGAIHNHILKEHEKRSTQLETRVNPIEEDYQFRHKLFTLVLGGGGLLGISVGIIKIISMVRAF